MDSETRKQIIHNLLSWLFIFHEIEGIVKFCTVHGALNEGDVWRRKRYVACKVCDKKSILKSRNKNKEKISLAMKKYREKNIIKIKQYAKKYRETKKEQIRMQKKDYTDKATDSYIKACIFKKSHVKFDLPKDYIEVRRDLLKLKRKLREIKNGNRER